MVPLASAQLVQLRHWSGQSVAPVYEGYDVNPDGSFNMWFGYMNRNYEEEIDLPIGEANHFEPIADSGHSFHPLRHSTPQGRVQGVTVPKKFLAIRKLDLDTGFARTKGTGDRDTEISLDDRSSAHHARRGNIETINSNTPPIVHVDPVQSIAASESVPLSITATDDGLPARNGRPIGMTVEWFKYRGPGEVTFAPMKSRIAEGKASAKANFSEPGEYILQAVVDDGSGELAGNFGYHCCWTNVEVKVTVRK